MKARVWGFLVVLMLAAPVGAQQFTVSQEETPTELEIEAGSSASFDVTVTLSGEGFACTSEVEAPVNATLAAGEASVTTEDAALAFAIPAGDYNTEAYNGTESAQLTVAAEGGETRNYTTTLDLVSTFPGGTYDACVPQEFPEASSEPAQITLDVIADEAPEEEEDEEPVNEVGNETDQNETAGDEQTDEEENGLPLPASLVPPSLLAAALLVSDRRREA